MVLELMQLEYCSATLSPYYPTLKPSVTHNRAKHTQPTNQTSQSRYLPLNLKLFPHKYSHSASQSRDLPLNLAICLSLHLRLALGLPVALLLMLSVSLSQGMSRSTRMFNLWVFLFVNLLFLCIV